MNESTAYGGCSTVVIAGVGPPPPPANFLARCRSTGFLLGRWICSLILLSSVAPSFASTLTSASLIERGKYLTNAADCVACHTAKDGIPYAGGRSMDTPFGPLVTPNITPDRQTGIGAWTEDQFYRALHDGIGRNGEYLYPAMPFPWYTNMSREDDRAIRAYLFSLKPVHKPREPSGLEFPFNIRESLGAWRAVFFKAGQFRSDSRQSAQVNRGAYLVKGPAHCGACHNSRLLAGQSSLQKPLQGGVIDSWYAPNITSDVHDGIGGWSDAQLVEYLKTGAAPGKGIAVGPMAETVSSLSQLKEDDLVAIAVYLKSTPPVADVEHPSAERPGSAAGGPLYLSNCAYCHGVSGRGLKGVVPALAGNGAVLAQGPENVIHAVVGGLEARLTFAPMPAVGAGMSDQDIADIANYVRASWGNHAPSAASVEMVQGVRGSVDTVMNGSSERSCSAVTPASLAQAIADPNRGVAQELVASEKTNLPQQIDAIVKRIGGLDPRPSQAQLINGLTAAYCRVVHQDPSLDRTARAQRLGHFSSLLYTRLNSGLQLASLPR